MTLSSHSSLTIGTIQQILLAEWRMSDKSDFFFLTVLDSFVASILATINSTALNIPLRTFCNHVLVICRTHYWICLLGQRLFAFKNVVAIVRLPP